MRLIKAVFLLLSGLQACDRTVKHMDKPVKDVVIIHSYPPGEWYHGIHAGLEDELKRAGVRYTLHPIVFHAEFWNEKDPERRAVEKKRILDFTRNANADLVLVCDDESADFIAEDLAALKYSVIFTGINKQKPDISWLNAFGKDQVAGTLELVRTEDSLALLQKLKPGVKTISILTSANETSGLTSKQVAEDMMRLQGKLNIKLNHIYKLRYWSQWKEVLAKVNSENDAVWVLVPYDVRNGSNEELSVEYIGKYLKSNLRIPSLGIISVSTKIGVLAAIPASPSALGKQMGEQTVEFFHGTPLSTVGITPAKYFRTEINYAQARRLRVVIPGSVARDSSLVDDHRLTFGR